ncbi:PAS domain-containing protein [Azospirillum sp. sgz302134]
MSPDSPDSAALARQSLAARNSRDVGLRLLKDLERLWEERRGGRIVPARQDFAFEDFRPWLGHIRIIRVEREPLRFKVTLDGSEIVNTAGVDLTGKYLDVVYGSDALKFLLDGYYPCIADRKPVYEVLTPNGALVNFGEIIRVLLPCGDETGVTHILYCEYAYNVLHWSRTVFANPGALKL